MVVQEDISMQGLRQIFTRTEIVGLQDVTDTSIETLHHAVGLWGSWLGKAVLNAEARPVIELMVSRVLTVLGAEQAVCLPPYAPRRCLHQRQCALSCRSATGRVCACCSFRGRARLVFDLCAGRGGA